MRVFERMRRDQDDVRFHTGRERLLVAASMMPLCVAGPGLSLWLSAYPDVPRWWALVAVAVWVLLAAWPIAVVNVRLRERVRRRRRHVPPATLRSGDAGRSR